MTNRTSFRSLCAAWLTVVVLLLERESKNNNSHFQCDALAASTVRKSQRRQRAAKQQQQQQQSLQNHVLVTSNQMDDDDENSLARERLWQMAGQTARRKRQRGRKVAVYEPVVDTSRGSTDSQTSKTSTKMSTEIDSLSNRIQPEDIQHVEWMASTDENDNMNIPNDFRAKVVLVNGTILSDIVPQTLHQRDDHAIWMALRRYAVDVSASEVSAILGNSIFTTRDLLLKRKAGLAFDSGTRNQKACDWGLRMEPKALRQYAEVTGNQVTETGLHVQSFDIGPKDLGSGATSVRRLIGASPDGIVQDSKDNSRGLLEIKSLWSRRNKKELPQFNHCPNRFFDQIQTQLAVTDLEWCDLMLYIPPNAGNPRKYKNYCILRVKRDRNYWNHSILPAVRSFCDELLELLQSDTVAP